MKAHRIILAIACCLTACTAFGQEKFYFRNGSSFSRRLVEANDREVKFIESKGGNPVTRGIDRQDVVVAFNAQGLYLVIKDLSTDPEISRNSLEKFYAAPGPASDVMIKSTPVEAIEGNITMRGEAVNYVTLDGKVASLNMRDLIAIIYKNGEHWVPGDINEVEDQLTAASNKLRKIAKASLKKNVTKTETNALEPASVKDTVATTELSLDAYKDYREKSIRQVDEFAGYLQTIASKNYSMNDRDLAIKNALLMFVPDTQVEVSSKNRKGVTRMPLETYLKRLKMLPYGNVKIKWSEIKYISELKQAEDGNYYGTIVGTQTFTGFSEQGQHEVYSDVTKKSVKVKLDSYQKQVNGEAVTGWNVLLGNIGVMSDE